MLVLNDVRHDARVLKEAQCLRGAGARVDILGMGLEQEAESRAATTPAPSAPANMAQGSSWAVGAADRVRLLAPMSRSEVAWPPLRLAQNLGHELRFQLELARRAAALRAHVYHCHDLQTLWAGLRAAAAVGASGRRSCQGTGGPWLTSRPRVVYDSHELFTERVGIAPWRAVLLRGYERHAMARVDLIIAASELRASIMHRDYGAPRLPITIINAARQSEAVDVPHPDALRARELITARHLILYQGGLHPGRGLEALIHGLALLPPEYGLAIMGAGRLGGELAARARARELEDRVHHWPPVAPNDVVAWAAAADAGVVTYLPTCRNNIYCAPNKLSEYAAAGLPVIGADLAGLRHFTDSHDLAELFRPGDPRSFASAARRLLGDSNRARAASVASRLMLREVCWESQARRLLRAYRRMLLL